MPTIEVSAKSAVEAILSAAFDSAVVVLDREVRELLAAEPRYVRFVMAVGWGNVLFDTKGKIVKDDALSPRAKEVIELADMIADTLGADNHEVP